MSTVTDFHLAWYFCLPRVIRPRPFHTMLAFPASLQSDWQAIINPWQEQTTLKAVWCTSRWLYRPKTQFDSVWADLWWPRCLQPLNAWHRQLPGAVKLFEFVTCANSSLLAPKIINDFFLSGDSTGRHSATVRSHFTTEHSGRVGPAHFMFIPQGANNTMFLFSISPAYRCRLFDRYDGRTASTLGSTRVLWICVLPVCVCARACVRECVRAWFRVRWSPPVPMSDTTSGPHITITVGWSQPIQDDQPLMSVSLVLGRPINAFSPQATANQCSGASTIQPLGPTDAAAQ